MPLFATFYAALLKRRLLSVVIKGPGILILLLTCQGCRNDINPKYGDNLAHR